MAEDQDQQPEQEEPTSQPEQPSEAPTDGSPRARRGNMMWIAIGGGGGLLLLIVIIAVVAILMRGGAGGSEPEGTAKYFPRDTVVYTWFTLNPGGGQREQMMDLWERFSEHSEFQDGLEDMLEDMEDDSGINFEDDVWPWIGPEISVAVLHLNDLESPEVAGMIGVRDHGAASDFLEDFLDYLEDEEGADFDDDTKGISRSGWTRERTLEPMRYRRTGLSSRPPRTHWKRSWT